MEPKENKMSPDRILKALLNGYHVKIGETVYGMLEDYDIGIKAEKQEIEDGQAVSVGVVWLKTHMAIKDFINLCESMTEEESVKLAFSVAVHRG